MLAHLRSLRASRGEMASAGSKPVQWNDQVRPAAWGLQISAADWKRRCHPKSLHNAPRVLGQARVPSLLGVEHTVVLMPDLSSLVASDVVLTTCDLTGEYKIGIRTTYGFQKIRFLPIIPGHVKTVSVSERRYYICKIFFDWPKPFQFDPPP